MTLESGLAAWIAANTVLMAFAWPSACRIRACRSPSARLVKHAGQVPVDLFPAGQRTLQIQRADDVTQRGDGQLLDRLKEVGDLVGGPYRIDHLEVEHRVDGHHQVV